MSENDWIDPDSDPPGEETPAANPLEENVPVNDADVAPFLHPLAPEQPESQGLEAIRPSPDGFLLQSEEQPLFSQYVHVARPREPRIPHFGHVCIVILIAFCGLFGASLFARLGVHFHLFGVANLTAAATEIHYTLGSEAIFYLLTFAGCLLIFPLLWHKGLMQGLQWRGATALLLRGRLVTGAVICFLLAMLNGWMMPGPSNAPIDQIFRIPGAAWMLFIFGITLAPFFEEIAFRGFLLPAFSTSFDWIAEKITGSAPRLNDEYGHPNWSLPAMCVASAITSVLFALMHAEQTGYSLGPFLLLFCVSLVLCWARLGARSLAASVMLHACYNFLLFSFMFLGTSGFKHLDKM